MKIQNMFQNDVNRKIHNVIKVDQEDETTAREIDEFVITRDVEKHLITFFNKYEDAFKTPTEDIGVWISGFYGSGKSHLLKMLSYLLENRTIGGVKTVERFRSKFVDDPLTFMTIENCTRGETESILFNIDVESVTPKDNTAVTRVFAKMFYNHLGFCGEDLKVARLEQFVAKKGKMEAFRRVFEEKSETRWVDSRSTIAFFEDFVVPTLEEVLGMSETAARNWFNGTEGGEISIAQLVSEIKDYVDSKPANFRLLFMVDEVGQYVGSDKALLLDLQSIVEKIGSVCRGKVWVVCTGQEALDEIIDTREAEFSRIQARFTRLSLSPSSVEEVIQRRILSKTPEAQKRLEKVYGENDSVLKNLFAFRDCVKDVKGYSGPAEFVKDFPFVPYQYTIMKNVYTEISKHHRPGTYVSGQVRSMMSGFQNVAQQIQDRDEYALVPLYRFYDTVHGQLDNTIRSVIERCQRAADYHDGLEQDDVKTLKLLYLLRYINDIKASLDNLVILMAEDINTDKMALRKRVQASLDRLLSQNYIGLTGDTYSFLTDEEQDIAREIRNTLVDTSSIEENIGKIIHEEIYGARKFRYEKSDFTFDLQVDTKNIGYFSGGICLQILTAASDIYDKSEFRLRNESKNKKVILVLADTPYYESLQQAMKIRKYVNHRNMRQVSNRVQDILSSYVSEARRLEAVTTDELKKAIISGEFYADGENLKITSGDAKEKIDKALGYLVSHVYKYLDLIKKNMESDEDISEILRSNPQTFGFEENRDAAAKMEDYLDMQKKLNHNTSMADIQSRYQKDPYGWREIDIAAVVAQLIAQQKVIAKYGGEVIRVDNPRLPAMLHKKTEIGKISISIKEHNSADNMRKVKAFLEDYFPEVMSIPSDEDGFIDFIAAKFEGQRAHYEELEKRYADRNGNINSSRYPDYPKLKEAQHLVAEVVSQKRDGIALVQRILLLEDELLDSRDDLQDLENFFNSNQVVVFDDAVELEKSLRDEQHYMQEEKEAYDALDKIRLITQVHVKTSNIYREIPELNGLMATIRAGHDKLLEAKRDELQEVIRQCLEVLHCTGDHSPACENIRKETDSYFDNMKETIYKEDNLLSLDGLMKNIWDYKDGMVRTLEDLSKPKTPAPDPKPESVSKPAPVKKIKKVYRQSVFPAKTLESRKDIDVYVEEVRRNLNEILEGSDGINIVG